MPLTKVARSVNAESFVVQDQAHDPSAQLARLPAASALRRLAGAPAPVTGAVFIEPVRDDAAVAAAAELARGFFAYMRETYPEHVADIDAYVIEQDVEGQLADFRAHFNPPHGECLLARLDGAPVGLVMLKPYAVGVCELNRMYVTRAARGRGVGRRLCEALIARARELGYRAVRLDALNEQVEALPLYRSLGFGSDPDPPPFARSHPQVVSMRLAL